MPVPVGNDRCAFWAESIVVGIGGELRSACDRCEPSRRMIGMYFGLRL
jgi:hypothetical protein